MAVSADLSSEPLTVMAWPPGLKPVGEVGFEDRLATLAGTPAG